MFGNKKELIEKMEQQGKDYLIFLKQTVENATHNQLEILGQFGTLEKQLGNIRMHLEGVMDLPRLIVIQRELDNFSKRVELILDEQKELRRIIERKEPKLETFISQMQKPVEPESKTLVPMAPIMPLTPILEPKKGKMLVSKGFQNDVTRRILAEHPRYAQIIWSADCIRDISIALNSSYEPVLTHTQLDNRIKPICKRHGKPTQFYEYRNYFLYSGMLSKEKHKTYRINKDNAIPQQKIKLSILEELGYDKDSMS